jgi:hypothetical protein
LDEILEPGFDAGALSTAYSIFTTGCETTRARHFLNGLNIEAPPGNELNKALKFVGGKIMRMEDGSCSEVNRRLDPGTVISLDGSWDHRRKGSRCFVVVCNQNTGEVLSCIVMSNKVPPNDPNYCGVPQNMEISGMARLTDDLKKYPEIVGYVHDNDAKIRKLFKLSRWEKITEFLDPGHVTKSFDRIFDKYPPLTPLRESLKRFLHCLLKG